MDTTPTISKNNDKDTLKRLNTWLVIIGIFMLIYTAGLFLFIEHRVDENQPNKAISITAVDPISGNIQSNYQNLFPLALLPKLSALTPVNNNTNIPVQMYMDKKSYEIQEFVIIKYFHQAGIVLEKKSGDRYVILC